MGKDNIEVAPNLRAAEPDQVTYWESRQINVGDYENISCGATFSMKFHAINRKDKKAEIYHREDIFVYPSMSPEEAFEQAQSRVRSVLDEREKSLRLSAHKYGGVSYDVLQKAQDFGIVSSSEASSAPTAANPDGINLDGLDDNEELSPRSQKKVEAAAVKKPMFKKRTAASTPSKQESFEFDDSDFDTGTKNEVKKKPSFKIKKDGLFGGGPEKGKLGKKQQGPPPLNTDEEIPF